MQYIISLMQGCCCSNYDAIFESIPLHLSFFSAGIGDFEYDGKH